MADTELGQNGSLMVNGNDVKIVKTPKPATHEVTEPPDGGARAWTIVISAFICNGIIFGIINTYSVIYLKLQEQLTEHGDLEASSKAALVGSLTIGTTFLLSPISGILTDKIGLRCTTFIGGALAAGGMLVSSFVTTNMYALCFSYGVMFGTGAALAYTPTLAILGHYFKRYLGKVNGFVTAGSSVFTAILPPILTWLVQTTGLASTFHVLAGVTMFIIVCSLVYKPTQAPPPPPKKKAGHSAAHTLVRSLVNVDNWKKKRYIIWSLSIPVALFGYFVPYVHMGKFVKDRFPGENENLPVMCVGITSGLGRLLFGFIADLPKVNRVLLQQISFIFIGTMTMLLPVTDSYPVLLVIALAMGLFDGCFISLLGPIAFDICGPRGATQAIGFLLGLCSLPLTVGPPIAGILYDHTKSYTLPFILAGIPPLIGASTMFLINFVKDEGNETDVVDKEQLSIPLAKPAWNDGNIGNGNGVQPPKQLTNGNGHPVRAERKASLASAESLNDIE